MSEDRAWRELRPGVWTLSGTAVELRHGDVPVLMPSGKPFTRSSPGSWSVYLDEGADRPQAVTFTLEEAKALAEAQLDAEFRE